MYKHRHTSKTYKLFLSMQISNYKSKICHSGNFIRFHEINVTGHILGPQFHWEISNEVKIIFKHLLNNNNEFLKITFEN